MTVRMPVRASALDSAEIACPAQESPRRRTYAHQWPFHSNLHAKLLQWWRLLGKLFRPTKVMLAGNAAAVSLAAGSEAVPASPFS